MKVAVYKCWFHDTRAYHSERRLTLIVELEEMRMQATKMSSAMERAARDLESEPEKDRALVARWMEQAGWGDRHP